MGLCLCSIIWYLSDTLLIPFCNPTLQKGIRRVSERYQKIMAWYPWHSCICTSLVIYFDVRFQISGGLINQGQTPSRVQAFWTLSDFFPALDYNGYSYKQLLFRTIKVFQQTLSNNDEIVSHYYLMKYQKCRIYLILNIIFRCAAPTIAFIEFTCYKYFAATLLCKCDGCSAPKYL